MSDTPIEPYTATSLRQFKLALAQAKEIKYIKFKSTSKGKNIHDNGLKTIMKCLNFIRL